MAGGHAGGFGQKALAEQAGGITIPAFADERHAAIGAGALAHFAPRAQIIKADIIIGQAGALLAQEHFIGAKARRAQGIGRANAQADHRRARRHGGARLAGRVRLGLLGAAVQVLNGFIALAEGVAGKARVKAGVFTILNGGANDGQQLCAALAQLLRALIAHIAQLVGGLQYAHHLIAGYVAPAVEHIGYRAVGNAGQPGNILEGRHARHRLSCTKIPAYYSLCWDLCQQTAPRNAKNRPF